MLRGGASGLALAAVLSAGCSKLVGLDDYAEAIDRSGLTAPDAYRFTRGASSFRVSASDGLLANDHEPGGVVPETRRTLRGGQVEIAADGSFVYRPPGTMGIFWGDDELEYTFAAGRVRDKGRARFTVQPLSVDLAALRGSAGAGFAMYTIPEAAVGIFPGSVGAAGDFNGDGFEDAVLGVVGVDLAGYGAYIAYGKADDYDLPLQRVGTQRVGGSYLQGDGGDGLGWFVGAAGDVNGDGFDDVIIGAPAFGLDEDGDLTEEGAGTGRAYVVFGGDQQGPVTTADLRAGSPQGFVLEGGLDAFGFAVAGAGDVNGDGFDDMIVGAPSTAFAGGPPGGVSYVVFGKAKPRNVTLSTAFDAEDAELAEGFRIIGANDGDFAGEYVAGAGDVNGDGFGDIIISASSHDFEYTDTGAAYVVFGKRDTATVHLSDIEMGSSAGFYIRGVDAEDSAGYPVCAVGDVNGDGLDDIALGAFRASVGVARDVSALVPDGGELNPEASEGAAYVVFGRSTPGMVALADVENELGGGFALSGSPPLQGAGLALAGGDVNGDGLNDLLVGSIPSADQSKAYLVFGKADAARLSLGSLELGSPGGLAIFASGGTYAGFGVAGGADMNGDGLDDMIIGSATIPGTTSPSGGAYVAFGWDMSGALAARGPALIGTHADDVLELSRLEPRAVRGGRGRDTLRVVGQDVTLDLRRPSPRYESIEVLDLRGDGPNTVILSEAALRRMPGAERDVRFELARTLSVLSDADDTVYFDLGGYTQLGGNEGRLVYARDGLYVGLELSPGTRVSWPPP